MRPEHLKHRVGLTLAISSIMTAACGCASTPAAGPHAADAFGRTYYIDGAGNWGYGVNEVPDGLQRAGYRGRIINWRWSPTLNPALDQTLGRPFARASGKALGSEINAYCREYPGREVNIIALSAGTGVATWACEALRPPARVHHLILLGSSLSSDYDFRDALDHIEAGIWVYFSNRDSILAGPVRAVGTIDGKIGADGAGLVGLHPRSGQTDKIHNIGWSAAYLRYGWSGSHTSATSEPFVRLVLARHIVTPPAEDPVTIAVSTNTPSSKNRSGSTQRRASAAGRGPTALLATR